MSKSPLKLIAIFIGFSFFALFGGCGTLLLGFYVAQPPEDSLVLYQKTTMDELIQRCGEPDQKRGYVRWNFPTCSSDLKVEVVFDPEAKTIVESKKYFANGGTSWRRYSKQRQTSVLNRNSK